MPMPVTVGVISAVCGDWEAERWQDTSTSNATKPSMKIKANFLDMSSS